MDASTTRRLGRSDVEVSQIGFGGAPFGNMYEAFPDRQAHAAIDACYGAGIRLFDTALRLRRV